MSNKILDLPEKPKGKRQRSFLLLLFLAACLVLVGNLFKIMHWQGGFIMIYVGCFALILVNLVKYLLRSAVDWLTFLKMAVTTIIVIGYALTTFGGVPLRILFVFGILALTAVLLKIALGINTDDE